MMSEQPESEKRLLESLDTLRALARGLPLRAEVAGLIPGFGAALTDLGRSKLKEGTDGIRAQLRDWAAYSEMEDGREKILRDIRGQIDVDRTRAILKTRAEDELIHKAREIARLGDELHEMIIDRMGRKRGPRPARRRYDLKYCLAARAAGRTRDAAQLALKGMPRFVSAVMAPGESREKLVADGQARIDFLAQVGEDRRPAWSALFHLLRTAFSEIQATGEPDAADGSALFEEWNAIYCASLDGLLRLTTLASWRAES
jgi:hypothetical protein